MTNVGVREVHEQEIIKMIKEGYTFEEIGEKFNRTRQAINSIIKRFFPDLHHNFISTQKAAKIAGVSEKKFLRFAEKMGHNPAHISSKKRMLWSEPVVIGISNVVKYLNICSRCNSFFSVDNLGRFCPHCKKEIKEIRRMRFLLRYTKNFRKGRLTCIICKSFLVGQKRSIICKRCLPPKNNIKK